MSDEPVHYVLGPAPRLGGVLLAAHGLAAAAVLWTPALAPALRVAVAALIGASLAGCWRTYVARAAPRAVRALSFDAVRGWRVHPRRGEAVDARPLAGSLVHPLVCVLVLRDVDGRRHAVVVLEEMLGATAYRRLRARLRARRGPSA